MLHASGTGFSHTRMRTGMLSLASATGNQPCMGSGRRTWRTACSQLQIPAGPRQQRTHQCCPLQSRPLCAWGGLHLPGRLSEGPVASVPGAQLLSWVQLRGLQAHWASPEAANQPCLCTHGSASLNPGHLAVMMTDHCSMSSVACHRRASLSHTHAVISLRMSMLASIMPGTFWSHSWSSWPLCRHSPLPPSLSLSLTLSLPLMEQHARHHGSPEDLAQGVASTGAHASSPVPQQQTQALGCSALHERAAAFGTQPGYRAHQSQRMAQRGSGVGGCQHPAVNPLCVEACCAALCCRPKGITSRLSKIMGGVASALSGVMVTQAAKLMQKIGAVPLPAQSNCLDAHEMIAQDTSYHCITTMAAMLQLCMLGCGKHLND